MSHPHTTAPDGSSLDTSRAQIYKTYEEVDKVRVEQIKTFKARIIELETALRMLVNDVAMYDAWQRPCLALDRARDVLGVPLTADSGREHLNKGG